MSGDFGIVYPLWTDAHGPAELLERAAGEIGLDHITIPVVTGRVEQFRLESPAPPHLFISDGGWHFPPDLPCYAAGPVKPRTARWFGRRDVLRPVCDFAQKHGIRIILRIDLRSVPGLIDEEPHLRTRNAWEEEAPPTGLCVMNPNVRELLRAVLEDLRRYAPAGIQLEEWTPDCPIHDPAPRPFGRNATFRRLMGTCFCPACREAGTDPEAARTSVTARISRAIAHAELTPIEPHDDPPLAAYTGSKFSDTVRWLQRLAYAHAGFRAFLLSKEERPLREYAQRLPANAFVPVLDGAAGARRVGDNPPEIAPLELGGPSGITVPASRVLFAEAQRLVRLVSRGVEAGCTFFDFEGLEEAGGEMFDWVRQAVRYARRG